MNYSYIRDGYTYEKIKTFEKGQAIMQDDFRWTKPLISEIVI